MVEGTPSKPFSEWDFPDMYRPYGLCESGDDPTLSIFSPFTCGCKDLKGESSPAILKHLIARTEAHAPNHVNEASKSHYVFSYLLSKFKIRSKKEHYRIRWV
ncbi:hypothetical protein Glove_85g120 [Diversispora epigaea]|uniref:Uncharacterized protein n=1 Tax=Diversispora epigaea TaxID=1348612 RepID=A0A397JDT7_9GLOM|nr:hypothetical protein Glove_85g120 [Diversispora epigaea]